MSLLKKMSRKTAKEKQNKPVSTRLTDSEFEAFSKLCDDTGYSVSEALRLLIQQEIEGVDHQYNTKSLQKYSEINEVSTTRETLSPIVKTPIQPSIKSTTTVNEDKKKIPSGRFSTTEWKVDNFLPCPICNTWTSAPNFARHAKEHDMTTQEIFTKHKEKADQMVKEREAN